MGLGWSMGRAKKSEWPLYKLTIQRQLYKITIEAPAQCRSLQSEHTAQGGDEFLLTIRLDVRGGQHRQVRGGY